jgi:hypothetical protein
MTHPTPIDITNKPDLVKIAEEVEATKTPRELKRENKTVAVIVPVTGAKQAKKQEKTKADYEAFFAAFGSWKDVDTDTLNKNIAEQRKRSNRPPLEL